MPDGISMVTKRAWDLSLMMPGHHGCSKTVCRERVVTDLGKMDMGSIQSSQQGQWDACVHKQHKPRSTCICANR